MKKQLIENNKDKVIELTYFAKNVKAKHKITGKIIDLMARSFLFNQNDIKNTKPLKINYENVISINEPELA